MPNKEAIKWLKANGLKPVRGEDNTWGTISIYEPPLEDPLEYRYSVMIQPKAILHEPTGTWRAFLHVSINWYFLGETIEQFKAEYKTRESKNSVQSALLECFTEMSDKWQNKTLEKELRKYPVAVAANDFIIEFKKKEKEHDNKL